MKHFVLCAIFLCGSLAWADLEEEEVAREPAQRPVKRATPEYRPQQQQPTSPQVLQQDDLFEQMRSLSGRIDTLENQISMLNAAKAGEKDGVAKDRQALEQKFIAYEEALKKLEAQIAAMSEELGKMRMAQAAPVKTPEKSGKEKSGERNPNKSYEDGEALFKEKKYKEAILAYERYRDANKKGKLYADATYKMGVCFQEVGLKDEAKIFFDEVISKFPGSKEAKKAAVRAKQLK